ncbi:hypothetical protein Z043_118412 [Scleropages formosus]|uniref:Uncharacterized protein n=1 Tax=Scleropages formosus TaxID=113540 RepID=A0A0P7UUF5_SCLFO|nr:hypothetical protein Z043_118412 [Scleropages formosus]
MELPVLPLDRPVPKHVLSRRGAISFSSSSSLFGAPDPRQLSQVPGARGAASSGTCGRSAAARAQKRAMAVRYTVIAVTRTLWEVRLREALTAAAQSKSGSRAQNVLERREATADVSRSHFLLLANVCHVGDKLVIAETAEGIEKLAQAKPPAEGSLWILVSQRNLLSQLFINRQHKHKTILNL